MSTQFYINLILFIAFASSVNGQVSQKVSFPSTDGLTVTADLYLKDKTAPTLLLFHQSVSSRGEFSTIAPRLQGLGYNCLAVDLRWGKRDFWNKVQNETATRNGTATVIAEYKEDTAYQLGKVWPIIWQSYQDMEASLRYLAKQGFTGPVWAMGSSFSALLIFKLAKEHSQVAGLLAFSPGEYHPTDEALLAGWAKEISVPVYLSAGKEERAMIAEVQQQLINSSHLYVHQSAGRHGASVLIDQAEDWPTLEGFLRKHATPIGFYPLRIDRPSSKWAKPSKYKPLSAYLWIPPGLSTGQDRLQRLAYIQARSLHEDSLYNTLVFRRILSSFLDKDSVSPRDLEIYLQEWLPTVSCGELPNQQLPLLVLSGAHPLYFLDLAERLAKAGYLVLSLARKGIEKGQRLPLNKAGVQEYKEDLGYVIEYLKDAGVVQEHSLAFVSWSFEGIPTLDLAKTHKAKVFISLDSALGYEYGIKLMEEPESAISITTPIIHFTSQDLGFGKDLSLVHEWESKHKHVSVNQDYDFTHGNFTSLGAVAIPRLTQEPPRKDFARFVQHLLQCLKHPTQ